ncbi:membrane protein involved in the export of O-antigen and teichoic acid [Sphaerochaeta pleomorpha str. Grapes]|uniref:Membrane protein involved in the export of O-antigen and teichoic acid n=1 Tax=Sphaerochaeta pleomorpha (strain ATCC BAA-1885 / DSM 22778 / Grapes) TaxID=158190 RepID=G8QWF5_SPHPG|nr:oligosaccharide flippase family protein [Sphaerochaeta pleomorpha]AEV29453.1 membrane protein involved in the export of O-antigen and teichoic acid [Sphaerochaeta pleomorpha str. Grapes]
MRKIKAKLQSSKYFQALAILTSGSLIGAFIIALQQILQTRIFSANDIGIFTFLLAIPMMFIGVMSLRYDIVIVTEKEERQVFALIKLSTVLVISLGVVITVFYVFYIALSNPKYFEYLYVTPFVFLILVGYGLNNICNSYNTRCKEYKLISSMYILRTFIQNCGVLLLGLLLVKLAGFKELSILVMFVPYGVSLFTGLILQSKSLMNHKDELKSITIIEMFEIAKRHKRQPFLSTPALFVNSFSFSIVPIILEQLFSTEVLGYYSVSDRVLGIPILLVAGNVAKVFVERASSEYNVTGKYINAYKQSVMFLVPISIAMFFGMFFLAPSICEILFGKGWGISGEYIRILAPMFSFRLVATALSQGLVVCNKQKTELIFNMMLAIASFGSGIVTWAFQGDIIVFLMLLCITRTCCYIFLTLIVFHYAKGNISNVKDNI